MGASPTYVPVIRTGVDVTFGDLAATGTLTVAGATTLTGDLSGGNASFTGQLEVDSTSTFNGAINAGTINPTLLSVVTGGNALRVFQAGDSQPRLNIDNTGTIALGPGGVTATDTTLSRSGAGALTTPGSLTVGGMLTAGGVRFPTGDFTPQDHGLEAWTHDPYLAASQSIATNGTLYLVRLNIRRAVTLDTIWWVIATAGVTPTAGQNLIGLYSSAGTLLTSVNVDADITSIGTKSNAITPQALAAGSFVWVGFLFNAATAPTLLRGSSFESSPNVNLAASVRRAAVNGTALTALPASIVPASNSTSGALTYFAGLSE